MVRVFDLLPLGDAAVVVRFGDAIDRVTHHRVQALVNSLEAQRFSWLVEAVPSFAAVTVFYDPVQVMETAELVRWRRASGKCKVGDGSWEERLLQEKGIGSHDSVYGVVCRLIEQVVGELTESVGNEPRVVEIPVCYGGEYGPDLGVVAAHNGLSEDEVVRIHTGGEYVVYMIGFAPGFPYLGGMAEEIQAPRRSSPRLAIPAGSVGIAGKQTGVYPMETPGGWQLIGRTPLPLFVPDAEPPSVLQAGDVVRFRAISQAELAAWTGKGQ